VPELELVRSLQKKVQIQKRLIELVLELELLTLHDHQLLLLELEIVYNRLYRFSFQT